MLRILLAVDGSPSSLDAVKFAHRMLETCGADGELHLVNVQPPLPAAAADFVPVEAVQGYHEDEGRKALEAAISLLDSAGRKYQTRVLIGDAATTISDCAKRWNCDLIIMGSRGYGAIQGLLLGSVTAKVLHISKVPVTIVK
jgi:nucleotide-binding universal stress UspA family protein